MAKPISDFKFKGTLGGICSVNSETYGEHYRRARGSVTPVDVNDAMKEAGARMRGSNRPAALINDGLKPFRENFSGGQFWQELVKHFSAQAKAGQPYHAKGLEEKEVYPKYPMNRMIRGKVNIMLNMLDLTMEISFPYRAVDRFLSRTPTVKGFQLTMIVLFFDFTYMEMEAVHHAIPFKRLTDKEPAVFNLSIPSGFPSYLLCCKAEACDDTEIAESTHTKKGMRILYTGDLPETAINGAF